jgi:hypothetical protein
MPFTHCSSAKTDELCCRAHRSEVFRPCVQKGIPKQSQGSTGLECSSAPLRLVPLTALAVLLEERRISGPPHDTVKKRPAHQISRALSPPSEASAIVLPADDIDLPTLAPKIVQGDERKTDDGLQAAPPLPATKSLPQRTQAARGARPMAKVRRAQPTAQQAAKPPTIASAGLKNVRVIGPLFSLFQ